eukprot:TRINITY_DN60082_c0_g1_i1.p1 TRINITY_DN60082_c0_g1~~TRINITY_DN60082_c0_g1_i1.p1  ORF type:complete len:183 (-),score=40.36 TRINITY_DN60082_c0_g1_i1:64-612(-)
MAAPQPGQHHAAGMTTLRFTQRAGEARRGVNMLGTVTNDSREALRTLAAHSLLGTRDQLLHKGAGRSADLRSLQVSQATDYPRYMQHSLSESTLHRWPQAPPATTHLSPAEVVSSGDIRLRAALPPAGIKSEAGDLKKFVNFTAVPYNFVAEQSTPIRSFERTGFMSLAHRDPSAPGVWLPQ